MAKTTTKNEVISYLASCARARGYFSTHEREFALVVARAVKSGVMECSTPLQAFHALKLLGQPDHNAVNNVATLWERGAAVFLFGVNGRLEFRKVPAA